MFVETTDEQPQHQQPDTAVATAAATAEYDTEDEEIDNIVNDVVENIQFDRSAPKLNAGWFLKNNMESVSLQNFPGHYQTNQNANDVLCDYMSKLLHNTAGMCYDRLNRA